MGFTLAGIVRRWGAERPDAPALTFEGRTVTYGELDERSSRVARGLETLGVGATDRIAFWDKNTPEFFEVLFGGAKLNAVNVAVNWRLAPAEALQVLNDAGAKVLFVGEGFTGELAKIEGDLETVHHIVVMGAEGSYERYEEWVDKHPADDPGITAAPDDVAVQMYTSGTTGLPKGVMTTNENLATLLEGALDEWGFRPDAVCLVCMPLFHVAGSGWALCALYSGCRVILLREVDPGAILEAIPRYRVTTTLFVPAVIQFLLAHPACDTTDFSSLEVCVYGASPISEGVLRGAIEAFGCGFVQAYGLTETTGAIIILRAEEHDPEGRPHLLRSAGKPYPWVEIRVVDPDTSRDVDVGEVGELWTRSAQNMKGYWQRPDETGAVFSADGWFRTGDAGYLDEQGYVYLHDRVKDMIVSGAENVYPAEVENVLMSHAGVADVAVVGVPHERWGESVKAVVLPAHGAEVSEEELVAFARERLAHYKCPTSVDFTDEPLPRNPSGKLLKRVIREPYWAGVDRRIH